MDIEAKELKTVTPVKDYINWKDNYSKFKFEDVVYVQGEGRDHSGVFKEVKVYYRYPNGIGQFYITEHESETRFRQKFFGRESDGRYVSYLVKILDVNKPLDKALLDIYQGLERVLFNKALKIKGKNCKCEDKMGKAFVEDYKSIVLPVEGSDNLFKLYRPLMDINYTDKRTGARCQKKAPIYRPTMTTASGKTPVEWKDLSGKTFDSAMEYQLYRLYMGGAFTTIKGSITEANITSVPKESSYENNTLDETIKASEKGSEMDGFFKFMESSKLGGVDLQNAVNGEFNGEVNQEIVEKASTMDDAWGNK